MKDMQKQVIYRNSRVVYKYRGSGPTIMLLHGYLETGEIWESFARKLEAGFRVITMDIPGHGNSGIWGTTHTMDEIAGSVCSVLDAEGIEKVFLAGHSMGGYVAMAFTEIYPERLYGYSLFHSTCFGDSEEKRKNREREISLILCGKKRQIINVNIPKSFADTNLERMEDEVRMAKRIAMNNSDEGIVALLNGMKDRPDRTPVLQNTNIPLLLIGGMKDNYIPVDLFDKLAGLAPHAKILRLENSGHMGFLEEPDKVIETLGRMIREIG